MIDLLLRNRPQPDKPVKDRSELVAKVIDEAEKGALDSDEFVDRRPALIHHRFKALPDVDPEVTHVV
jgi:hypothetical protein